MDNVNFAKKAWLLVAIIILAAAIGLIFIFWQKTLPPELISSTPEQQIPDITQGQSPAQNNPITSQNNTSSTPTSTTPNTPTTSTSSTTSTPGTSASSGIPSVDTVSDETIPTPPSTTTFQEITSTIPNRR